MSPFFAVGQVIGALIATFLLSRLLFWITRGWQGGITQTVFVHCVAFMVAAVASTFGHADGGPLMPYEAALPYFFPQIFWMAVDLLIRGKAKADRVLDMGEQK